MADRIITITISCEYIMYQETTNIDMLYCVCVCVCVSRLQCNDMLTSLYTDRMTCVCLFILATLYIHVYTYIHHVILIACYIHTYTSCDFCREL